MINTWADLPSFDITVAAAGGGALEFEASLSPKGEVATAAERASVATVGRVTFIRSAGKVNLYEVETSGGPRRVAAPSEAEARAMIEEGR